MKTYTLNEPSAPYTMPQDMLPTDEPVILVRAGQPVAALLPFAEYERYRTWRTHQTPQPLL